MSRREIRRSTTSCPSGKPQVGPVRAGLGSARWRLERDHHPALLPSLLDRRGLAAQPDPADSRTVDLVVVHLQPKRLEQLASHSPGLWWHTTIIGASPPLVVYGIRSLAPVVLPNTRADGAWTRYTPVRTGEFGLAAVTAQGWELPLSASSRESFRKARIRFVRRSKSGHDYAQVPTRK